MKKDELLSVFPTPVQIYKYENNIENESYWNGVMIPIYQNNQNLSKYLDIWINANGIEENSLDDSFKVHIDIGYISEDINENNKLDTEDEPVYGPGMGDNILSDGEDIGVDQCTNSYEDGFGGCLCEIYSDAIYNRN